MHQTTKKTDITNKDYDENRKLWHEFNQISPDDKETIRNILKDNLGHFGHGSAVVQPFFCDIGKNLFVGDNTYINYNFTVLGSGIVKIGNNVAISSGTTVIAIDHPGNPCCGEWADIPMNVTIEDNVWIGANVTIMGGITIGTHAMIGAGSVVTSNVEPYAVVCGNPAKPTR